MEDAASSFNGVLHAVQQGGRTPFQIAQFLAEDVVAGSADAPDAAPDPGSGQVAGVVVELQLEELAPQDLIGLVTHPAPDPAGGLHVVQRAPVVTLGGKECVQAIAQLGHHAQTLEAEQRHGIAPGLQPVLEPVAHAGFRPAHPVGQTQLVQYLQEGMVRDAVEVVVAFDVQAAKVEGGRHAPHAVVGLEHHGLITIQCQLIGNSQPHGAGSQYGNACPVVHGVRTPARSCRSEDR